MNIFKYFILLCNKVKSVFQKPEETYYHIGGHTSDSISEKEPEPIIAKDVLEEDFDLNPPVVNVLELNSEGNIERLAFTEMQDLNNGDLFYFSMPNSISFPLYKVRGTPRIYYENGKSLLSISKSKIGEFDLSTLSYTLDELEE